MNKPEKFWDGASKNYDKTEERFEYIHSKSRENTKKYLDSSNVVLDYGCGTGTTSCEIANHVKEIHAIDISSKMIEIDIPIGISLKLFLYRIFVIHTL